MAIVADGVRFVKPGEFTGDSAEVCPDWLRFVQVIGVKGALEGGGWVNCEFSYRKPNRDFYVLEAALEINLHMEQTGVCYVRCCSCPDFQKKRGPARQQSRVRFCKHMKALHARLVRQAGQPAPSLESLPLGVFRIHTNTLAALGEAVAA